MPRCGSSFWAIPALILATLSLVPQDADACTSFLVSKGASADGSTMITYAADAHDLYGELYFTPPAKHAPGAKREIRDWDSQKVLGQIDQPPETYRVVGNINEHQVAIGETTFGGRKELRDLKGGIDYGSMIYVALERAKTARDAIRIMTDLANEHGYYSKGETFSIADPNEVWIMDLIGKGPEEKGVVWVACKVPDGFVTAHANQPRIRTFPRNDPDQCVYAEDVVSFAKKKGYYDGPDEKFSFVDAYATQTCRDLRMREGRVWSFYNQVAPSQKIPSDYPACKPGAQPLPLWVKPDKKLTVRDLMVGMRDHFEDTVFDMRKDVGAGPFELPYRWRPLTWEHGGKTYAHERATATQQTGFSFVSQSRAWMPGEIGGLLWFSVDDAASTVYVPMYAGLREVPKPYAVGTATFEEFSWDSAFWVFNWVANFTYLRYSDMIKDVQKAQGQLEGGFFHSQTELERRATELHAESPERAARLLTQYSADASDKVMRRWKDLGPELLVKYMDGNVRDEKGKPAHPPYPDSWYARIVAEKGAHLHLPDEDGGVSPAASAVPAVSSDPVLPGKSSGCSVMLPGKASWLHVLPVLGFLGLVARRTSRRTTPR
jgi:dipeptidase